MIASEAHTSTCDYCGLPLQPSRPVGNSHWATDQPQYCCFGCRFAAKVTQQRGDAGHLHWMLVRLGLSIFCTMNVMIFTMVLWSGDIYTAAGSPSDPLAVSVTELFRYVCLVFSLPVLLLLGGPLLENAWSSLSQRRLSSDLLIVLGVAAAYVYSVVSLLQGERYTYFEVGCMVLVAVTLGRWFEATGKWKTTEALRSLQRLLPDTVRLLRDGHYVRCSLDQVSSGDCLRILPGERIPVDGVVLASRAYVDQQIVTGESEAVVKQSGEAVVGGSLNLDGDLKIRVTGPPGEGTLQRLVDMVRAAATRQGRYQRLAERIARWFIPAVFLVSLATFAFHGWRDDFQTGLLAALSVVLISCPCALGLATPMAVWAAMGRACQAQVLFRDGDTLSRLARIRAVCFDKTGTLTNGTAVVDQLVVQNASDRSEIVRRAAAAAACSTHTLATAVVEWGGPGPLPAARLLEQIPGRGIRVALQDETDVLFLGSPRLMRESGLRMSPQLQQAVAESRVAGHSILCLGWDAVVRGVFVFREQLRTGARQTLQACGQLGLHVSVLTGDHSSRAAALRLLQPVAVKAELLPQEKLEALAETRRTHGATAMIGDGINDAPALAAADVGIAMGSGVDVARQTADVCLLGDNLLRLPWAVQLARATDRTIRQNLFWAFFYNGIGIALAAGGMLNPIVAALAMLVSSFLVVSNSLRLTAFDLPSPPTQRASLQQAAAAEVAVGPMLPGGQAG